MSIKKYMASKLGRYDPCYSGSGKKYKRCHSNMQSEEPYSKRRIFHEVNRASKHSKCLHPLASKQHCSGKIIDAHTIQRSASLSVLVDERRHVKTFYQKEPQANGVDYPIDIGWHDASTFTGFCE